MKQPESQTRKNYLTKPQLPIEHKQVEDFLEAGFVYFVGVGFF